MKYYSRKRCFKSVDLFINGIQFRNLAITNLAPRAFSRKRILTLPILAYAILDPGKETTAVKLERLRQINPSLANTGNKGKTVSQQAFSKARQNLNPEAVQAIFYQTVSDYSDTEGTDGLDKYGYYHFMADGTWIRLYKSRENRRGAILKDDCPMALASVLYDPVGLCAVEAVLSFEERNENTLLVENLKKCKERGFDLNKILVIADRGYDSIWLFQSLNKLGVKFVIRGRKLREGNKRFPEIYNQKDFDATKDFGELRLRCLSVDIGKPDCEILYTNDTTRSKSEFKDLYNERWSEECLFKRAKSNYELEAVGGNSPLIAAQDFWATMTIGGMIASIARELNQQLNEENYDSENYTCKINDNKTIGFLKIFFLQMCMEFNEDKRNQMLNQLDELILRYAMTYKKHRTFGRSLSLNVRHPINHRSNV